MKVEAPPKPYDISIIIVSYNVKELLENCIESIHASLSDLHVQIVVVDNASTDGTRSLAERESTDFTFIENQENLGFSRANNLGLQRAKGRYILLLNPDTVLEPRVLEKMTAYMDQHPRTGMATCKLVTGDGSLDLACRRRFPSLWDGLCRASGLSALFPKSRLFAGYNLTYLNEDESYEVEAINGAFMFIRRRALKEVGFLDEDYYIYVEDLDWCYRFREAGWKIVYHPETTTLHLKGQSGKQVSSPMIRRLFESTEIFYRKHYFPGMGPLHKGMILVSLRLWKRVTLLKNALKRHKRTRP